MNKRTLTATIIGVAILSVMTTKAIDKSGGVAEYVVGIVFALVGDSNRQ